MPLANARALLPATDAQPAVVFRRWQPEQDCQALEELRRRCLRFSPIVAFGYESPAQSLLLDMTGCERLFGGEDAMVRRVAETFAKWGYWARIALADTPRAAHALARYHRSSPPDLPLDTLRTGRTTSNGFRWRRAGEIQTEVEWVIARAGHTMQAVRHLPPHALGLPEAVVQQLVALDLHSLRALIGIPRYALQERFGTALLERLDLLFGLKEEPLHPPQDPPSLCELWQFDVASDDASLVHYVVERLLARLVRAALQRSHSISKLTLTLFFETGPSQSIHVTLFHPTASFDHLHTLLELQLEQLVLADRVEAIRLEANELVSQGPKQQTLFAGICDETHSQRWAMLIERLVHRLGNEQVLTVVDVPDAQPEYAVRCVPVSPSAQPRYGGKKGGRQSRARNQNAADHSATQTARPVRLLNPPEKLTVTMRTAQGIPVKFRGYGRSWTAHRFGEPERIETGWWRTRRTVRRDYYRVETVDGVQLWLFRDLNDGQWYLHGIFD